MEGLLLVLLSVLKIALNLLIRNNFVQSDFGVLISEASFGPNLVVGINSILGPPTHFVSRNHLGNGHLTELENFIMYLTYFQSLQ